MIPIFYGTIEDGEFRAGKDLEFKVYKERMEGARVALTLQKVKKPRSNDQNGYYRGVVVKMVAEEMGLTYAQAHDFLGREFLIEGRDVNGKRFDVVRSTTELSTVEFEEYMKQCRQFGDMELGIYIPKPHEVIPE